MKKIMLIGMVLLVSLSFDVGKASNVSTTEKTLMYTDLSELSNDVMASDVVILIVSENQLYAFNEVKNLNINLVAITPAPIELDLNRPSSYIDYKQNGYLKPKFHSWYLFNPLKLC